MAYYIENDSLDGLNNNDLTLSGRTIPTPETTDIQFMHSLNITERYRLITFIES